MSPTFVDGDRVFLNLSAYRDRMPEPGDIVFFEDPAARERLLVKRCIAIGGQRRNALRVREGFGRKPVSTGRCGGEMCWR